MDIRTAIWEARLDAKGIASYYNRRAQWFARCDRTTATLGALLGSASIVTWFITHASTGVPLLVLLSAILNVLPAFAPWTKWSLEAEYAHRHWVKRDLVWDGLWLRVASDPDAVSIEQFQAERERDMDFCEPGSPTSDRLARRCQFEVHRSLGLTLPEQT